MCGRCRNHEMRNTHTVSSKTQKGTTSVIWENNIITCRGFLRDLHTYKTGFD
jgi:hypothetical protein